MQSKIAQALELKYAPVALLFSDEKPLDAMQFEPNRWGCVMAAFGAVAEKGKTYIFDRETFGCPGGGVGLGFGNCYKQFVGGEEGFCGFLAQGNQDTERGRAAIEVAKKYMRGSMLEHFIHGEAYRKTPEAVQKFVKALPMMEIPTRYLVMKPLSKVSESETPVVIVFLANPDQLSALTILANYERGDSENVIVPHAAGCQSIGIYAYREANSPQQRGIIGLNDISARKMLRRLGADLMTFAAPWGLFNEMEQNVKGSFIERETWKSLKVD